MTGWRDRLLRIGADPRDDHETRLRKVLLLSAALMIVPLAVVWGTIYWIFADPLAAAIPWTYAALSSLSIVAFAWRRSYSWFISSQLTLYLLLPFVLMWVLGGFVTGSAVVLWSLIAPLAALVLHGRQRAIPWLLVYFALLAVSVVPHDAFGAAHPLSALLVVAFFVLNLGFVSLVAFVLLSAFAGGREAMLDAVGGLVHYLSPSVASDLISHPERIELGGDVVEITVLFADLRGFTTYAESHSPAEAVGLLNRRFAIAIPLILAEGGTPIQLAGDQVMAIFNAPVAQPDHALRAARVALGIQRQSASIAASGASVEPRFGIGINTGSALVGNIGSEEFRNFTAIGDTTNMAARLQALAAPGEVVLGPRTAAKLGHAAVTERMGNVRVKGKAQPIETFSLVSLEVKAQPA